MHQIDQAGAASLFQRVVNMSGTPVMLRPLRETVAEGIYQTVIAILGLQDACVADRISVLLSIPAHEFLSKLPPGLPFLPVLDGRTITNDATFAGLSPNLEHDGAQHIDMLIGSCDMDVSICVYWNLDSSKLPLTP